MVHGLNTIKMINERAVKAEKEEKALSEDVEWPTRDELKKPKSEVKE